MKYRELSKTLITLAFSLCLYQIAVGQDKTIELPQTEGLELKFSKNHITQFFSIYINKEKEVYFENIKLDSMIQLVDTINKYRNKLNDEHSVFGHFFLYADRNLPYATIDSVRSILGSIHIGRLFYMTNDVEDISSGFGRRIRAALTYRKVLVPGSDKLVDISRDPPKGSGVNKHPIQIMLDQLYAQKFEEAKR